MADAITPITEALVTALAALGTGEGETKVFKLVAQFAGDEQTELARLAAAAPAAMVKWTGGPLACVNRASGAHLHEPEFLVVVSVSALKSSANASASAAALIKQVTDELAGSDLDLDLEPLEFTAIDLLALIADRELWVLRLKTKLEW